MDSPIVLNFFVGEFVSDVLMWLMTIEPPTQNSVVEFNLRYVKAILTFFPFPLKLTFPPSLSSLFSTRWLMLSLSLSKIDEMKLSLF